MNKDIRLAVSFKGHRKRKKLKRLLGFGAEVYLIDLWITVAMDCPDGNLSGWSDEDIADACDWQEAPEIFVNALIESKWLNKDSDGNYSLHDWDEHQGWACKAKLRSESAKKAADARWEKKRKPTAKPTDSGSNATALRPHKGSNADSNAPSPSPSPSPSPTTPLNPPKGENEVLKDYLVKNIPTQFNGTSKKIIEFFKYRQQKPKAKKYQSEKGINGLFRDLSNCQAIGYDLNTCLDIAMERGWQTPSVDYFKPEMFTAAPIPTKPKTIADREQEEKELFANRSMR